MFFICGYTKAVHSSGFEQPTSKTVIANSRLIRKPTPAAYSPSFVYRIAVPLKVIFSQPIEEMTVVA